MGKVARPRLGARRLLGEQQAALGDGALARFVLGRIDDVDAAGDYRDRPGPDRAVMGGGVDAAGEAGDDDGAGIAQLERELAGEAAGGGRGVARPDHRHRLPFEQGGVALRDQRRRRVFDLGEQGGIEPLAEKEVAGAELRDPLDLALDLADAGEPGRAAAAAGGEVGNGVDRRLGRSEPGEQMGKGDRADLVRPDQSQPGDLIGRREHHVSRRRPSPPSARCP